MNRECTSDKLNGVDLNKCEYFAEYECMYLYLCACVCLYISMCEILIRMKKLFLLLLVETK